MDTSMHIEGLTSLSKTNRKRSARHREADSEDSSNEVDDGPVIDSNQDTSSSKRSRNRHGVAIHRRVLRYNAQALLSQLAFTQLYVTANFRNYNPSSSPILICIVSKHDALYRGMCQILPTLYGVAPGLQGLAIVPGMLEVPLTGQGDLARVVPVMTTSGLGEDIADDFHSFRQALSEPDDAIVVIDASGTCLWTSADLTVGETTDFHCLAAHLDSALVKVLKQLCPPDEMDQG